MTARNNYVLWHGRGSGREPVLPVLPKRARRVCSGVSVRRERLTSVQRMQLLRAGVIGLCLGAFVGWGLGTLWDAFVPETVPSHWDFPRVTPGDRLEYAPRSPRPWGAEL
jgi:hypothetical protein